MSVLTSQVQSRPIREATVTDDRYRDKRDPTFGHPPARHPNGQHPDGQTRSDDVRPRYHEHPSVNTDSRYRSAPGYEAARNGEDHNRYSDDNYRQNPRHDVTYPVEFNGKTSEYFKIWIVNIFLTIITLYIYSAWAKVRTKRYFYGNTSIDGSTFEYHATGKQLVVGRLIAAALLITYTASQGISGTLTLVAFTTMLVMFPWAIWRSLKFNARASSFRNIRFGFDGKAATPYINFLIIPLIVVALIGIASYFVYRQYGPVDFNDPTSTSPQLLAIAGAGFLIIFIAVVSIIIPFLHRNLISYSHNNHRYGTAKFAAGIKTGRIYGIHFVALLLSFLALALVSVLIFAAFKLFTSPDFIRQNVELIERLQPHRETIASVAIYLIMIPATGLAVAYFQSSIRNHRYNVTTIGSGVKLNSGVGTWSLWWLSFSNLMLILLTIGLAYPYTKIRSARYFARHTSVTVAGGLESFTENERTRLNVMGEEMADAFDVEFDIGV